MKLKILVFVFLSLILFQSCNSGGYTQNYDHYEDFKKIENGRLSGWFPTELIKSDAYNIKNISYLSTKCIFGVFNYENEENYKAIFKKENFIDETHNKIFQSQIDLVKDIYPRWFPTAEYWQTKKNDIILIDNCYAFKDSVNKKIYYFHPKEESTFVNGKIYPGIRNTIR